MLKVQKVTTAQVTADMVTEAEAIRSMYRAIDNPDLARRAISPTGALRLASNNMWESIPHNGHKRVKGKDGKMARVQPNGKQATPASCASFCLTFDAAWGDAELRDRLRILATVAQGQGKGQGNAGRVLTLLAAIDAACAQADALDLEIPSS